MKERILTKDNSKILQGIAILMMVYHHIFIDGNLWCINEGTSLINIFNFINIGKAATAQMNFAWFCKICVAIFAFASGYGIFIQLENKTKEKIDLKEMYKYCFKRFLSFFKSFIICFLFFNICIILTTPKGEGSFDYSFPNFLINALGLRTDYNGTFWYIPVYYCMIFISPLVYILLKKVDYKKIFIFIVAVLVIGSLIALATGSIVDYLKGVSTFIQQYQTIFLIIFMEGMFCGRYQLIETIYNKLNLFTGILLLAITYVGRTLLIRAPSDSLFDLVFTLPFVISVIKILSYTKGLRKFFGFIGKYSAYIWYSHAYFYSYLFFGLVFKSDMSLIVYLQVVIYSLACGIVFDNIIKLIESCIKKIGTN